MIWPVIPIPFLILYWIGSGRMSRILLRTLRSVINLEVMLILEETVNYQLFFDVSGLVWGEGPQLASSLVPNDEVRKDFCWSL